LSGGPDSPARQRALKLGAALREPAERLGVSPATLAIAFTLRHPRTAATLIGATRPEQIDDALAAVELAKRLTDGELSRLRELAR
jgi:aryl-alcohol dehydrogenase-like predicted oxidoreductase